MIRHTSPSLRARISCAIVIAIAGLPGAARAQDGAKTARPVRVTTELLRAACSFASTQGYSDRENVSADSPAGRLERFCALPAPANAEAVRNWLTTPLPEIRHVESAAAGKAIPLEPVAAPGLRGRRRDAVGAVQEGDRASLPAVGSAFMANQGIILVGLAQHAVGRAKETVNIYVIEAFAKRLCTTETKYKLADVDRVDTLSSYIPETCRLLNVGGDKSQLMGSRFGMPSWAIVQATLRKDLDVLPDTVMSRFRRLGALALRANEPGRELLASQQRLTMTLASARFGVSYLRHNDLAGAFRDAASEMVATTYAMCLPDLEAADPCGISLDAVPGVQRALVASSLLGTGTAQDLRTLIDNPSRREEVLTVLLKALALNVSSDLDADPTLRLAWTRFLTAREMLQSESGLLFQPVRMWSFAAPLIDSLTGLSLGVRRAIDDAGTDREKKIRALIGGMSQAVPLLVTVADSLLEDPASIERLRLIQRVARYTEWRAEGRYAELLADMITLIQDVGAGEHLVLFQKVTFAPSAMRAMQFAVDAAGVTDADAFQAVLESYASPADGFLRKRIRPEGTMPGYWSLNTYVGGARGREAAIDASLPGGKDHENYSGLWLPLGLEIGLKTKIGAFGVMAQGLDLGQVASWRSRQGDTTVSVAPPGLTFASVFAPGVNLIYHFPNWPIAIGRGYARAPQFRDVISDDEFPRKADARRRIWFLAVDVPLLP